MSPRSLTSEQVSSLRAAGDLLAARHTDGDTTPMIVSLNPYYTADGDDPPRRVNDTTRVQAVDRLLALVRDAAGADASAWAASRLKLRAERFPEGDCYVWELDESAWLLLADLVLFRALEVLRGQPREAFLTSREVEARYGLQPGTARKAVNRKQVSALKRGHDLLFKPADAEACWGKAEDKNDLA